MFKKYLKKDIVLKMSIGLIITLIVQFVLLASVLNKSKESYNDLIYNESYEKLLYLIKEKKIYEDEKTYNIADKIASSVTTSDIPESEVKYNLEEVLENPELLSIFRSSLNDEENILIGTSDKVLMGNYNVYQMSNHNNKKYFDIEWEGFFNNFKNPDSIRNSFERIFNLEPLHDNSLLMFVDDDLVIDIDESDVSSIKTLLKNSPAELSKLKFISVSYITEDGDIFETKDYDFLGNPVKNNKMIVVKVFSINDLSSEIVSVELSNLESKIKNTEMAFDRLYLVIELITIFCIFICAILCFTINVIHENRIRKI